MRVQLYLATCLLSDFMKKSSAVGHSLLLLSVSSYLQMFQCPSLCVFVSQSFYLTSSLSVFLFLCVLCSVSSALRVSVSLCPDISMFVCAYLWISVFYLCVFRSLRVFVCLRLSVSSCLRLSLFFCVRASPFLFCHVCVSPCLRVSVSLSLRFTVSPCVCTFVAP